MRGFVAFSCSGGRRRVLVILVMVMCLLHLLLQHHVLQRFTVFRGAGGKRGKESAVTLRSLTPSNGDSEAKDGYHSDLGNDTVIPLKWRPEVRWPLMVFSTVGRLGNCLNSYAFALAFRDAYPATVAVTQPIVKRIRTVLASENLTLPVIDMKFEQDADEEDALEVVEPDYLKDDMVSHLAPTFQRAVREFREDGGRKVFLLPGYPNRMWMLAQHLSSIRASFRVRAELQQEARRFLEKARKGKGSRFHLRRAAHSPR
ncbi:hypothetical protein O3P69_010489 [Scylla paramamosain]|uniref:Uncharacterized protein n=1 Tax=Scylla paramamosain TaxID=85552 RepID=A0AAW0TTC0_SCYPA